MKSRKADEIEKGITLEMIVDCKAAILTIKSFDKGILKSNYKQKFRKEVKRIFRKLEEAGIEHLAIDLRDNQAGALSNGIYLLQHLMINPFRCVYYYYQILRSGKRKKLRTKWDNFFEPQTKFHFQGDVFLFINEGSYSCSAIVANTFKEAKRGQVLGKMSGGGAFVNSGAPNEVVTLPNTKIDFVIPKTQYVLRENMDRIGKGVAFSIHVQDDPLSLIKGEDAYKDRFLSLLEN